MNLKLQLLKKFSPIAFSITLLLCWALTSTYAALKNKGETLIIAIDSNGTRLVSKNTDPIFKTEIISFFKYFNDSLYNFNSQNFEDKVGPITSYFSNELWEKEKSKISQLQKLTKSKNIISTSNIQKISKINNKSFDLLIDHTFKENLSKTKKTLKLSVQIELVKRSKLNPWGILIDDIKETHISN